MCVSEGGWVRQGARQRQAAGAVPPSGQQANRTAGGGPPLPSPAQVARMLVNMHNQVAAGDFSYVEQVRIFSFFVVLVLFFLRWAVAP